MAGTLTVGGLTTGLPTGEKVLGPVTMTGTATIGEILDFSLSTGDNTFTVPTGAYAVAVFLGASQTATIKVRSNLNASDQGLPVAPYTGTGFSVFPLPAGTSSLTLNSSGSVTGCEMTFI